MTNAPSGPRSGGAERRLTFPKSKRLLKPAEFRLVYDKGFKVPCTCFVAFCWKNAEAGGSRVGFTTPRALGKAVARNRMRRRLRETIRRRVSALGDCWWVVWNLRTACLSAPQSTLDSEVSKVFERCKD